MTSTRPRIALIGSGRMGSLHARVLAQSSLCDLALLVEPREEHGREVAARFDTAWAADFDELDGIDAAVVAAATPAHYDWRAASSTSASRCSSKSRSPQRTRRARIW